MSLESEPFASRTPHREILPFSTHPYRVFEQRVRGRLSPKCVLLDAGCGRTAERLRRLAPSIQCGIGIDLVDFQQREAGLLLLKANLEQIPLRSECIDLAMSVSVMEHLQNPLGAYREIQRILRPGGSFLFLTPNLWDYGSLAAKLIPSRLHPFLVARLEGRKEEDTLPTHFRSNTLGAVRNLAQQSGFSVECHEYLSQYPNYFLFNRTLFYLGMAFEKTIARMAPPLRGWLMVMLQRN
jgi:SAM-dependent methyltransferase